MIYLMNSYIRDPIENCKGVDFVMQESESTLKVYSDVEDWLKECLDVGTNCKLYEDANAIAGDLTHVGYPSTYVDHNNYGWYVEILNRNVKGKKTLEGNSWIFDCESWEGAYSAKNVSQIELRSSFVSCLSRPVHFSFN